MNSKLRDRLAVGAFATAAVLTLWLEGHPLETKAPAKAPQLIQGSAEAPPTLRGSTPEFRLATEREEQICQENAYRGEGPAGGDCRWVPTGTIYEDDPWGRWNCATMGNLICGPSRAMLHASEPRLLTLTG